MGSSPTHMTWLLGVRTAGSNELSVNRLGCSHGRSRHLSSQLVGCHNWLLLGVRPFGVEGDSEWSLAGGQWTKHRVGVVGQTVCNRVSRVSRKPRCKAFLGAKA